ncbi:Sirohydrochlorin ferrochelatase [Staphylococcus devriesei]|nr:Sirohydrochlorin ferrochelatase [Staphylococcus devriesei]
MKGMREMVANILVAHGMRKGEQNKALGEFLEHLLSDETYDYELAFIESEEKSIEKTVERLIRQGETRFKVVPLLIFSAMHYIVDIPEILENIKHTHPEISYEISDPLGTHDYMVDLVEKRINDVQIDKTKNYAIVLIAHGSFSYTQAHEELKEFSGKLTQEAPIYSRTLYGDITFRNDLDQLSRQYEELIIVPLFLYDGRLVNKVKRLISEMEIESTLHITPSINFDNILKLIISERLAQLTV